MLDQPHRQKRVRLRDLLGQKPRRRLKINPMVKARLKAKHREAIFFSGALHPPGVGPGGKPQPSMAMDDANFSSLGWADNAVSSIIAEGMTFLGYPYLSELAQRPEYRRVVEVIANEMTRKFIKLTAKGNAESKSAKISKMNAEMKRLKVRDVFRQATELDGFFGRGHIYIDTGDTDDRDELVTDLGDGRNDISQAKVKKGDLKGLRTLEPVWCWPTQYNSTNPLKKDWYVPKQWYAMSTPMHATRLLTMIGREVPDLLKPAYSFGGLSLTQMVKAYIDNWLRTRQSVSNLISNFSTTGVKTDLGESLKEGGEELFERAEFFNLTRDNQGLMLLGEDEEFFNVATPLGTLDKLQAQALEHICSVSAIPLVKYTGISPSGLNASSEGEIRVFYDWIKSFQEKFFTEPLHTILGFIQLNLFGSIDEDIEFEFEPLMELTELEKSAKRKTDADTGTVLIDNGVIHPEEERKRVANDPDTLYEGLDIDDMPDPEGEELARQKELMGAQAKLMPKPMPGQGPLGAAGGPGLGPPSGMAAKGMGAPGKGSKPPPKLAAKAASSKKPTKAPSSKSKMAKDEEDNQDSLPFDPEDFFALDWEEAKHPRVPAGHGKGGEFTFKGAGEAGKGGVRLSGTGKPLPEHIAKLRIPPGWKEVRYNPDAKGELLVVGRDAKGRRVAIYSEAASMKTAKAKFARINELNTKFDSIMSQNEAARRSHDNKDVADCTRLIMMTGIRPGSSADRGAKVQAYGATTLLGKHVEVEGSKVTLKFTGKKGVHLSIPVTDKVTAGILKSRKADAGPNGRLFEINEKQLLDHVHSFDGGGFKTKDFRTLLGTHTAIDEVKKRAAPTSMSDYKKKVKEVATVVSSKLGNTPTIALQSYINPSVFSEWRMAA